MNSKLLVALVVLLGLVGGVNSFSDVEERFWPLFRTQQIFTSTYPHCEAHVTAINKTVNKMLRLRVGSGCEFTLEDSDGNVHVCRIQPDLPFPTGYRELFYGYVILNQGKQLVQDFVKQEDISKIQVQTVQNNENDILKELKNYILSKDIDDNQNEQSSLSSILLSESQQQESLSLQSFQKTISEIKKSLKTQN